MEAAQPVLKTVEKAPRACQSDSNVWHSNRVVGVTPSPTLMHRNNAEPQLTPHHNYMSSIVPVHSETPTSNSAVTHFVPNTHTTSPSATTSPVVASLTSPVKAMATKRGASTSLEHCRRSGRKRTSTVIQINGQTVLKENNYVLKGFAYHFGDNTEQAPPVKKHRTTADASTPKQPRAPRVVAPAELARQAHNAVIKKRIADKARVRMEHLARNKDSLYFFLDPVVQGKVDAIKVASSEKQHAELYLQPDAIQADMRDYQLAGLNWMVKMHDRNLGMILGDEMGLGKTIQTISLFCHLKEKQGMTGPSLVICPLSVLYSWCNELTKWAPSLKFIRFHSSSTEERESQRNILSQDAHSYDVVVTTYEMAKQPQLRNFWNRQYFNYLVLDEGHKIKESTTQISQAVRVIHRENALILTGTPLQNNLVELWSLLNFLYPDVFISSEPFAQGFDISNNLVNKDTLMGAQKLLSLFMLRRLKDEVEKLMPKKLETKVLCPLSSTQVFWYKSLLLKDIGILARSVDDKDTALGNKAKLLNNLIMQLRKCCLHPFLFPGAEANIDDTSLEELIAASGKLAVLDKLLRSLYTKGHRTVLFSQFTSVLDILEDYCVLRGWSYCRFDGGTARATRNYIVNTFNEPGSQKFIFLMSTRSGGMGLNLQTADTCILYDSDWNPQPDLQAMARVHRIGQTKTVHVYRLVTNGTIEERMVERAEKKLFMDRMVNTGGGAGMDDVVDKITDKDMVSTLRFGCNAVFGEDDGTKNHLPTDKDIATITDRLRTEDFSGGNLKGGVASKTGDFDADKHLTSTMNLGGVDFRAILAEQRRKAREQGDEGPKDLSGISVKWKEMLDQKRKRKSRLIMVDGMKSGYGKATVPVLAANNYQLEHGESSVFASELKTTNRDAFVVKKRKVKIAGVDYEHQDFCQVCGDGGELLCCPRCPISVHVHHECSGVDDTKEFLCCSHHRCGECGKNGAAAGGLLFACESCPSSYCEDCLPPKSIMLGDSQRFLELGFTAKNYVYIHCSDICNNVAKKEFGWKKPSKARIACPPVLDLSEHFGAKVEEALQASTDEASSGPLRPRRAKAAAPCYKVGKNHSVSPASKLKKEENEILNAAAMHKKVVAKIAERNEVIDLTDDTDDAKPSPRGKNSNAPVALPSRVYDIVTNGDIRTVLL